jgi:hypothetical protein
MSRSFAASRAAYAGGDGAEAKRLSEEGKRHKAEMERFDKEASNWIFQRAYRRFTTIIYCPLTLILYFRGQHGFCA